MREEAQEAANPSYPSGVLYTSLEHRPGNIAPKSPKSFRAMS
jgi:hypothetical protein